MILGLRTAMYTAPDLERGKLFYSQVLQTAPYFDEPFYVGFAVGGFELGLVPDGPTGAGGCAAYWGVADITAAAAWVSVCGGNLQGDIQDVGEGIKVAEFTDPFGNRFGLIQNPNFNPAVVR